MMKRDISRITNQLETQSQTLRDVLEMCDLIDPDVARMKDDISSITEELETQRKKLEEVGKVCEKTHESVENILKELQSNKTVGLKVQLEGSAVRRNKRWTPSAV